MKIVYLFLVAFLISVTTSHAQLYLGAGDIESWDPTTGQEINSASTADGSSADSAVVSGDTLYVVGTSADGNNFNLGSYNSTTLAVINPEIASTPLISNPGAFPNALVVYGDDVYLANGAYNNSAVDLINTTTGAVNTTFITTGDIITGLALSGNTLYVVNWADSSISTYNATTGALITANLIVQAQGEIIGQIAIEGNTVYVNDGNQHIQSYDATTGALLNDNIIPTFSANADVPTDDPANIQDFLLGLAAAGNELYVTDYTTGTVDAYNDVTGAYINTVAVAGTVGGISIDDGDLGSGFGNNDLGAAPEPRAWLFAALVLLSVAASRCKLWAGIFPSKELAGLS